MPSNTIAIDWRKHEKKIMMFVENGGGVVHVKGAKAAPFIHFKNRLVEEWLPSRSAGVWIPCFIDLQDPHALHTMGFVKNIARELNIDLPTSRSPIEIQVGTHNRTVVGNTSIGTVSVEVNENKRDIDLEQECRDFLIKAFQEMDQSTGIALILLGTHRLDSFMSSHYSNEFWHGYFERFVGTRLFLIAMYEQDDHNASTDSFPPAAYDTIELHTLLGDSEFEQTAAKEDIEKWALENSLYESQNDANIVAHTMVNSHETMNSLQASLHVLAARHRSRLND